MNKGISKWPSKVLNLLVVLAMVISLSAILVAPSIAVAADDEACPRAPVYDGCHLSVAVSTYIKDADGNFIPQTTFTPNVDCFYVNAVVVNDGNNTVNAPINATISFPNGGVAIDTYQAAYQDGETQTWPGTQGTDSLLPGRIADFWWKVCCDSDNGNTEIRVNVTGNSACDQEWPAVGTTYVTQEVTGETPCLEVKIVEAPGLGPVTGRLINTDTGLPVVYNSGMPNTILPCQNFGIKAEITNLCDGEVNVGNVTINSPWRNASLVGGDPVSWDVGTLQANSTAVVAWTLHCDGQGDVSVDVTTRAALGNITYYVNDPILVHQETAGELQVRFTQPACTEDCTDSCVIKEPSTSSCQNQQFDVQAVVLYTGAGTLANCYADLSASPSSGWVTVGPGTSNLLRWSGTLTGGVPRPVDFGNVTIVSGADAVGNLTVRLYSMATGAPPEATPAKLSVSVQKVIAEISPGSTTPSTVNICDPSGFDVTYRYYNWSGIDWASPNVTACIDWSGLGNVSLESVWWRKITSGAVPGTFYNIPLGSTTLTEGQDCMTPPETICKCCSFDVKWHFKCTYEGSVTFQGNVSVSQTSPAFTGSDTSPYVCVDQVWKAELWTDIAFFVQNDNRIMVEQDAMVPGNQFHVVIPVINTGDATATNVQVYFTIVDAPTAPCTQSYELVSTSGDATIQSLGLGQYVATFAAIPGHSAEKAVLLLQCLCEGQVSVFIPEHMVGVNGWTDDDPGMKAFDANTPGVAVPVDDIHVPPCPVVFQQVPFTVTMENPVTCQSFSPGDTFAVKALIHNGSIAQSFDDITATLHVLSAGGADLLGSTVILMGNETRAKPVGNISAGLDSEVTWTVQCNGAGEAYISVSAASTTPMLTATSDVVNVHQVQPPGACLEVTILSPGPYTYIATGQEFAVTAKIENNGPDDAENVVVTIDPPSCSSLHYVTLVDGESDTRQYDSIGAGDFEVATWTLWGGSDSEYMMRDCNAVNDTICVAATMDTEIAGSCNTDASDSVSVSVYPAAFLVATIDSITPSTGIVLGSEFTVNYTVTNYGVADAWSTTVTLSANPDASVRIAEGEGGYTQFLSTIPGWTWGEPFTSVEGNFTLHCVAEGPSTLTITPLGDDECGWQPKDPPGGFTWANLPGDPIQSRFLVPASETIMQTVTGACPDLTSVDITLKSGWNLMSLPLIPNNGAIGTVLSGISSHVNSVWYYDGANWLSWSPGVGGSLSTMDQKKAYWISMKTDSATYTLTENGSVGLPPPGLPTTIDVAAGWNMIGFKSTCARTAGSYLSGVPFVRIWSFANGAWSAVQSGDKMQPGLGYWIAATGAGTIFP